MPSVQGINLQINSGQCLGLIGPNGAGKSTLLSIISGLLIPTSGSINFNHNGQLSFTKFIQQNVALVPQEYAFYLQLTVSQNLAYFVSLCGFTQQERQARVSKVLQQCQLEDVSKQSAMSLSGGYKRRLNLAIALLKNPQILYLDEPTVGVDPISREAILTLLKSLKKHGKTIIYTSHLLSEVQDICEEIVMLNKGQASYLTLDKQHKCINIEFDEILPSGVLQQLANLPVKIVIKDKHLSAEIGADETLFLLLAILEHSQVGILNIHYDQTSLTQYYLNFMEQHATAKY